MKLYCTTYIDDELPEERSRRAMWAGTVADQTKDAKTLKSEGMRDIAQQLVNVPTDKPGLLQFLNDRGVQP